MIDNEFNELLASVKEAGEIIHKKRLPSKVTTVDLPDIRGIRAKLNLSQQMFAQLIGISPRTLQNWEQGTRTPEGPAIALLKVADKNPKAVYEALHV